MPRPGLKQRVRDSMARADGARVFEDTFLGLRCARAEIEIFDGMNYPQLEKRFFIAGAALREMGVREVCFSRGFEYEPLLLDDGFVKMDCRFLYESLAGDIVKILGREDRKKKVAFFANRVSRNEERALVAICSYFRYIMLEIRHDGDYICRNIRRRMGAAVVENPTGKQIAEADIALFFSPTVGKVILPPECTVVTTDGENLKNADCRRIVSGLRLSLPGDVKSGLPENFPKEPLLSQGARLGRVNTRRIKIEALAVEKTKTGLDRK